MANLFVTTSEYDRLDDVVDELLREDVKPPQIRVFSMSPERLRGLAVKVVRYRPPAANIVYGATLGVAVAVVVGLLLMLAGFGVAPVLVLVIAFAIGGALSRLWFGHGLAGELYRLDDAMRHGNAVMVLDVEQGRVAPLQRDLSRRHPELSVLGIDAEGTPPFP
jgi:hypothetical protein